MAATSVMAGTIQGEGVEGEPGVWLAGCHQFNRRGGLESCAMWHDPIGRERKHGENEAP